MISAAAMVLRYLGSVDGAVRFGHQLSRRLRNDQLRKSKAISEDEYFEAEKSFLVCRARCARTAAEKETRLALGTLVAQGNLAEAKRN